MASPFDDILQANQVFASSYADPHLPGRAARGLAIVTCMDSRIDPLAMVGLQRGDAKILRNAGRALRTMCYGRWSLPSTCWASSGS
jgi:carbonic anhydrase